MYGNANIPLIELLDDCFTDQAWHADDGNNVGSLDNLKKSFDSLEKHCSYFAYHLFEKAKPIIFNGKVEIVDGCSIFCSVRVPIIQWEVLERSLKRQKSLLKKLAAQANVSPQNVYKSFTSVQHKLTLLARTTPNIEDFLKECEKSVSDELSPNLLKNSTYNPKYRDIVSFPIREGGLNILKHEERLMLWNMNDQFNCQAPYLYLLPKLN